MSDLEGLLVITVEQAVAAPYASGRLADAGARVIKVERQEGDFARRYDHTVNGESAYFVWLNRGKESISLDLRDASDRGLLERMIAKADVLIQNLAPGKMASMGLGSEALRAKHPRLITCDISGYGEEGPYRDLKAYDLLVQAETGLCSITGAPEGPGRVGVSVCDIAAGMSALHGILRALYARERTGVGSGVRTSLFQALADWMNVPYLQSTYGGVEPKRVGLNHPTIAPYGAYPCQDGRPILISIQNETEWRVLCCDVLERPDLAQDPRFGTNSDRVAHRQALDAVIVEVFGRFDREAMAAKLEAARIAFGRVSSLADLREHPQTRYVDVATPSGPARMLMPGYEMTGESMALRPVPGLNAQGEALRAEFGGVAAPA